MDSGGGNSYLVNFADDVLEHCDVRNACGKAPHLPIAGPSTVLMFNEMVKADLLLLDNQIALRAIDMFREYPLPLPVQPENPQEVSDVSCGGWLGALGPPKCLPMDEGGEWENELWADITRNSRELEPILGHWNVAMRLLVEFITGSLKMAGF